MKQRITDNLDYLKAILPAHLSQAIQKIGEEETLIEIIMDLGRVPTARYTTGERQLADQEVTEADIQTVTGQIRHFDADNRSGIERTLHRISAIRNRTDKVVGLTCRIGRAVYGTIDIIHDIILSGKSVILLGPPGVGKTTMLREAARVLADKRRVVVVDTSNEIGGDGDVPHPAVGRARRMQVKEPSQQHEVMIEAVENHNPEVIVIDEIGRELEALAARTIAERGVQLIGTAHGNTLENLLKNPTLSDLLGGIESVTLSDDEARRRGTQKTVLERRSQPTFDVLIEIQSRERLLIHEDVAAAVDAHLRGIPLPLELRYVGENGGVQIETVMPQRKEATGPQLATLGLMERFAPERPERAPQRPERPTVALPSNPAAKSPRDLNEAKEGREDSRPEGKRAQVVRAYLYGIARNRLSQSAKRLGVPLMIVDEMEAADVVITLKNYYRRRPRLIVDAERRGTSVYVLRANTVTQMEDFLFDVFGLEERDGDPAADAVREAEEAVRLVQTDGQAIDLRPQPNHLRRRQHDLARQANLVSHSYGVEPHRYVRILSPDASSAK
jgi:stage III sporulation protein SpoIIIAA